MTKNNIILVNYVFTQDSNKGYLLVDKIERFNFFNNMNNMKVEDINFLIDDGVFSKAQQINFGTTDYYDICKYNYAIVYKTKDDEIDYDSIRYYYVKSINQSGGGLYSLQLELDDIMTNYYDNRNNIYGMVKRAHINRFKKVGNNYQYDISKNDGFLSQASTYNTNKYLKKTFKLSCNENNTEVPNSTMLKWISEHVKYWVVAIISNGSYKTPIADSVNALPLNYSSVNGGGSFTCPYCVCYYPVMEKGYSLQVNFKKGEKSYYMTFSERSFEDFLKIDGNSPKIYNIIYTKAIMFSFINCDYVILGNKLILMGSRPDYSTGMIYPTKGGIEYRGYSAFLPTEVIREETSNTFGIFWGCYYEGNRNYDSSELNEYLNGSSSFNIDNIKNFSNFYSPILVSGNVMSLRLNDDSGSYYDYDYSLMLLSDTYKDVKFKISSTIDTSGVTTYARLGGSYGIYNDYYINSQIGLNESDITSIPWANDKFSEYVASNKNYMFTAISNIAGSTLGGLMPALGNVETATLGSTALGLSKGAISGAMTTAKTIASFENMRESKDSLFSNSTSFFLKTVKDKHGYFVDLYDTIEIDKQRILNDCLVNGYVVDKLGFASNYDSIRKYYNYLSIYVEEIQAPLSNLEKTRLISKLQGFTFVNKDADVRSLYKNKNYEVYLDE